MTLPALLIESHRIILSLIENEGEVTPELEALMAETHFKLAEKVDRYAYVLEMLETQEIWYRSKAHEFSHMAARLEANRQKMKDRMKEMMVAINQNELSGNEVRFKLINGKGHIEIDPNTDPKDVPAPFRREKFEFDKIAIRGAIELGATLDFATLEPTKELRKYNKGAK